MEIVKRRYSIEFAPIRSTRTQHFPAWDTNLWETDMRVMDAYTGAPIGVVSLPRQKLSGEKRDYEAYRLPDREKVDASTGSWGTRFDLAAAAVWETYDKELPRMERLKRWVWRWVEVGWFVFGTVGGGIAGAFATLWLKGPGTV